MHNPAFPGFAHLTGPLDVMRPVLQRLAVDLRVLAVRQLRHPHLPAGRGVRGDVVAAGRAGGGSGGGGAAGGARPVAAHAAGVGVADLVVLVLVPLQQQVQLAGALPNTHIHTTDGEAGRTHAHTRQVILLHGEGCGPSGYELTLD